VLYGDPGSHVNVPTYSIHCIKMSGHPRPFPWRSGGQRLIGGAAEGGWRAVAGDFGVGWLRARTERRYATTPSLLQICNTRSRCCKKYEAPKSDAAAVGGVFLPLAAASNSYSRNFLILHHLLEML
jgi:hypothetical protein